MRSAIDVAAEDNRLSEPEPDLILTAKGVREYETNPSPGEVRLLVVVSDSTVSYDLCKKAPIYACAEIIEYWVVDLPGKLVHVHREPEHGRYASIVKCGLETRSGRWQNPMRQSA
jgi:Uma2 family endonuclease